MLTSHRTLKLATVVAAALAPLAYGTGAMAQPLLPPLFPPARPPAPAPAPAPVVPTMLAVEQRLELLRYDVGTVDGVFDEVTSDAVMAFQKTHGLERTGQLTEPVTTMILAFTTPPPLEPGGGANRVEIDLTRQILMVYEGGALTRILPISSGTASTPTPNGSYRIYRQARGWETSRLGRLYNSQYFVGGYAIHGSLSVPAQPASHGCVRLTMRAAEWFPDHVGIGTPVYVLGG